MDPRKIDHMKARREKTGSSLRATAEEFGTSKSTAHRKIGESKMAKDGNWIESAVKGGKGKLHEKLGVPEGKKIPEKKLEKATHSSSKKEKKEADLALELKGFHHGGSAFEKKGK
jgi:hypothetical protein